MIGADVTVTLTGARVDPDPARPASGSRLATQALDQRQQTADDRSKNAGPIHKASRQPCGP